MPATTYILKPSGLLDTTDGRVTRHTGAPVRKVQPAGCPLNGTMRQCYVERVDTGAFVGMVNLASLTRAVRRYCVVCSAEVLAAERSDEATGEVRCSRC